MDGWEDMRKKWKEKRRKERKRERERGDSFDNESRALFFARPKGTIVLGRKLQRKEGRKRGGRAEEQRETRTSKCIHAHTHTKTKNEERTNKEKDGGSLLLC